MNTPSGNHRCSTVQRVALDARYLHDWHAFQRHATKRRLRAISSASTVMNENGPIDTTGLRERAQSHVEGRTGFVFTSPAAICLSTQPTPTDNRGQTTFSDNPIFAKPWSVPDSP
jgi:hypothetical protein